MSDRKALIRRWNKYHPINREVARHIQVLEQQGESIVGTREMLNVLALCLWAVEHPKFEIRWWARDSDGGGMWLSLDADYILDIHKGWHPKTVMDFFKYEYDADDPTDAPTQILDHLKEEGRGQPEPSAGLAQRLRRQRGRRPAHRASAQATLPDCPF